MLSHQYSGAIHRPARHGYAPSSTKPSDFDTIDWHALNHEAARVPRSSQVAHLVAAKPALIFLQVFGVEYRKISIIPVGSLFLAKTRAVQASP